MKVFFLIYNWTLNYCFHNFKIDILEAAFLRTHYPDVNIIDRLANMLSLSTERISVWFQNRRARFKRAKKQIREDDEQDNFSGDISNMTTQQESIVNFINMTKMMAKSGQQPPYQRLMHRTKSSVSSAKQEVEEEDENEDKSSETESQTTSHPTQSEQIAQDPYGACYHNIKLPVKNNEHVVETNENSCYNQAQSRDSYTPSSSVSNTSTSSNSDSTESSNLDSNQINQPQNYYYQYQNYQQLNGFNNNNYAYQASNSNQVSKETESQKKANQTSGSSRSSTPKSADSSSSEADSSPKSQPDASYTSPVSSANNSVRSETAASIPQIHPTGYYASSVGYNTSIGYSDSGYYQQHYAAQMPYASAYQAHYYQQPNFYHQNFFQAYADSNGTMAQQQPYQYSQVYTNPVTSIKKESVQNGYEY
jgi:hypothetical protein